ncbi:MAG TPA: alpha/beta hydrolase [Mycobacteriales bacterium]|jgi:pimeloyl-ACP methyl ester carboxylesterase|nr:alpha/beta hydrolase [Mycobacteriales bacterium]
MRRGYVDAPWGQIHYKEQGSGEAVLLYPNRPRSSVIYERLAGLLAERYRVVLIDPPGFGGSDPLPEPFEVADLTSSVTHLLDGLGIDRVRMSGHHTGATICVDLAATFPERVVAIAPCGTLLLTDTERAGRLDGTAWSPAYGNPMKEDGSHLLPFLKKFPPKPPEDLQFLNDVIIDNLVSEPYQVPSAQAVYRYPEREHLAKVTAPTLFVQSSGPGEPPTLQRADTVLDLVPGSAIHVIEGGDVHFIHHRADELSGILLDFFGKADAQATA